MKKQALVCLPEEDYFVSSSFVCKFSDGLARPKASWAVDADTAVGVRGGGFPRWLHNWVVPDDGSHICWWCGSHHIGHCPQLAFLQSQPAQVVGPERSREASQAAATAACEFKEESLQEVRSRSLLTDHSNGVAFVSFTVSFVTPKYRAKIWMRHLHCKTYVFSTLYNEWLELEEMFLVSAALCFMRFWFRNRKPFALLLTVNRCKIIYKSNLITVI